MELTYGLKLTASTYTEPFTPREIQVLTLLADGNLNKEIASQLNISIETVKKHLKHIYKKTGAQNRIEAINKTKWLTASLEATNTYC